METIVSTPLATVTEVITSSKLVKVTLWGLIGILVEGKWLGR